MNTHGMTERKVQVNSTVAAATKAAVIQPRKSNINFNTSTRENRMHIKGSASAPAKSEKFKRRVEPVESLKPVKSHEDVPKIFRETPLPRVAYLTPNPKTRSNSTKKKAQLKNISANKNPKKSSKVTKRDGTSRRTKSAKKLKKKYKSVLPNPPPPGDAGRQYVKEIGTINHLIRSVTGSRPSTQNGREHELVQGVVRPFSADELGQLLKSIGNVATIHQRTLPLNANSEAAVGLEKTLLISSAISSRPLEPYSSSLPNLNPKSKPTKKSRSKTPRKNVSRKSIKDKSKSKIHEVLTVGEDTTDILTRKKQKSKVLKKKSSVKSSKGITKNKSIKDTKSVKSEIKALLKSTKSKFKRKSSKRRSKDSVVSDVIKIDSDAVLNEMSELDLVKSALLNKMYYEESMALKRMNSTELTVASRKRGKSRHTKTKSKKVGKEDLEEVDMFKLSPIASSRSSSKHSYRESENERKKENIAAAHGIRLLGAALKAKEAEIRHQTKKDVLINYSHVIRGPDPIAQRITFGDDGHTVRARNHRGFNNPRPYPYKLEVDLDEVEGFDKHLQKIKYTGITPASEGLLNLRPMYRPASKSSPTTGKYLRNEEILQNTRSKATTLRAPTPPSTIPQNKIVEKTSSTNFSSTKVRSKGKSKSYRKHTETSRSRSRSRNKPYDIELAFNPAHQKAFPNKNLTNLIEKNPKNNTEPTIENLTKAPSNWKPSSLYPSVMDSFGNELESSPWSTLNQKTVQKNKEIGIKSVGRRRHIPKDDLDEIRRTLESSTDRKQYLQNISQKDKVLDTYNAYYSAKNEIDGIKSQSKNTNHR